MRTLLFVIAVLCFCTDHMGIYVLGVILLGIVSFHPETDKIMIIKAETTLTFGKHAGKKADQLVWADPDYILWMNSRPNLLVDKELYRRAALQTHLAR